MSIHKTYPIQVRKVLADGHKARPVGMGQMMFTKYIMVVNHDVDVHNTSEVLFRDAANHQPDLNLCQK